MIHSSNPNFDNALEHFDWYFANDASITWSTPPINRAESHGWTRYEKGFVENKIVKYFDFLGFNFWYQLVDFIDVIMGAIDVLNELNINTKQCTNSHNLSE